LFATDSKNNLVIIEQQYFENKNFAESNIPIDDMYELKGDCTTG
jgi:hypothetical protein